MISKVEIGKILDNKITKEKILFGTAGFRSTIGIGENEFNIVSVCEITLGLIKHLYNKYPNEELKIAIGYDPRYRTEDFIEMILRICTDNNIKVYIYSEIKPTPMLSYLIRNKKTHAGIMLTASHNAKEYHGYKVYNQSGAQINLEEASDIEKNIHNIDNIDKMKYFEEKFIKNEKIIEWIKEELDREYLEDIKNLVNRSNKKKIKIIYSPLHGTGYKIIPKFLKEFGFENIKTVESQMFPDSEFRNTKSTNPEELIAYEEALKNAKLYNSDLILLTDPDADRIGIMIKNRDEKYVHLTGNETGSLLINYLIKRDKITSGTIYKTIVTGELGACIARENNIKIVETLTGFKFIGEEIEKNPNEKFIFGYEESYGYLISKCVRDKDGIQAAILISDMVNSYLEKNLYLDEVLEKLYNRYGKIEEETISLEFQSKKSILKVMKYFREKKLKEISGIDIEKKIDYLNKQNNLPISDVLKFQFQDNIGWLILRPSGTEPKLKIYVSVKLKSDKFIKMKKDIKNIINDII